MKKLLCFVLTMLLCLQLAFAVSAAPDRQYIIDEFEVLDTGELETLNEIAADIYDTRGVGVFFAYMYVEDPAQYDVSTLVDGMENYVVMLENEDYWYLHTAGKGDAADADLLREAYDAEETYYSGVEMFLQSAAACFPLSQNAETSPTAFDSQMPPVSDDAMLLPEAESASVEAKLDQVSRENGAQIAVATIGSMEEGDIDDFVEFLYDNCNYGYGADRSGVLLLVCMEPREFRILSNGKAQDAIGSSEIQSISDAITPLLKSGDYAGAFREFADSCSYYLDGAANGFPFDWSTNLIISLIIGLVIGLITAFVFKGQLKTVRPQNQADVYVRSGSMHLTQERDLYLYRTVTREAKQQDNDRSGGNSGSRSVGGGSF